MGGRKEKWEGEGWKHGTREVGRKRGRDGSREKGKEGASESTLTVGLTAWLTVLSQDLQSSVSSFYALLTLSACLVFCSAMWHNFSSTQWYCMLPLKAN